MLEGLNSWIDVFPEVPEVSAGFPLAPPTDAASIPDESPLEAISRSLVFRFCLFRFLTVLRRLRVDVNLFSRSDSGRAFVKVRGGRLGPVGPEIPMGEPILPLGESFL